jgi:hypothetical protein
MTAGDTILLGAPTPECYGAYCRGCDVLVAVAMARVGEKRLAAFRRVNDREDIRGLTVARAREEMATWGCRCAENRKAATQAARGSVVLAVDPSRFSPQSVAVEALTPPIATPPERDPR